MMRKSGPTIHDVASHLGLSISTISFVINGRADQQRISPHTIARVNNYIKEIGYVPDRCAQSFRTKRTGIIGLLIEDLADMPTAIFVKQFEQIAFNEGFKIIVQQLIGEEKVKKIMTSLYDNQIEAYLVLLGKQLSSETLKKLNTVPMPIIFFSLDHIKADDAHINQARMEDIKPDQVKQLFAALKSRLLKK